MRRRTHYHLPVARRTRRSGKFLGALVLLLLGAGGWAWWTLETRKESSPVKHPAPIIVPQPSPTRAQSNVVAKTIPSTVTQIPTAPATTNVRAASSVATSVATPALISFPRSPRDIFETQIALTRRSISSGSIDGVMGSQTRAALAAFQSQAGLASSGELDAPTRAALALDSAPLTTYTVTSNDLTCLQPLSKTWLGKSQQTALDYETLLELVAEKGHASPNLTQRLNPKVNWTNVAIGAEVQIPAVEYPPPVKAAFATIRLGEKHLQVFDVRTNLIAHFPCSIAARVEKRPAGELHVTAIAPNPNYTFDPEVFPESEEARQIKNKLILPPGPNNPVGTAWISLDKPGYGLHGTPKPEQVGRTESHGCFRLANWNAEYLLKLVWVGMPVYVEP